MPGRVRIPGELRLTICAAQVRGIVVTTALPVLAEQHPFAISRNILERGASSQERSRSLVSPATFAINTP
jgi:hypothetical protein